MKPTETPTQPCPFCGCKTIRQETGESNSIFMFCRHCHARGPVAGEAEDARRYWNERAGEAGDWAELIQVAEDYYRYFGPEKQDLDERYEKWKKAR